MTGRRRAHPAGWSGISLAITGGIVVAILLAIDVRNYVQCEHPLLLGYQGSVYLSIIGILSLAGWWWGGFQIRPAYIVCAAAMSALVGMRAQVWDYYLADVAIFGFFGVEPVLQRQERGWELPGRVLGYGALAVLLWFHHGFTVSTKQALDWNHALVSLCERSLRSGQIQPADLSVAPFGFRGWHLYPYFVANDGSRGAYIADFEKYLRLGALRLQVDGWKDAPPTGANGKLHDDEKLLLSDVFDFEWTGKRRFSLIKQPSSEKPGLEIRSAKYTFDRFPLNDEEWRQHLTVREGE